MVGPLGVQKGSETLVICVSYLRTLKFLENGVGVGPMPLIVAPDSEIATDRNNLDKPIEKDTGVRCECEILDATLNIKIHVSQTSPIVPEEVVILTYISDAISRHPVWPARQSYTKGLPNRLEDFVLSSDCQSSLG
jgi:hypothetical protein